MTNLKQIDPYDIYNKLVAMNSIGGSRYPIAINGKTFIAGNFDIDELFITITGMTKEEYDKKNYKDNYFNNYYSWLATGKNLIPKELHDSWRELLVSCQNDFSYYGKEIEYSLAVIQTIQYGKSIDDALNDILSEPTELPEHFKTIVQEIVRKFTITPKIKKKQ